ncbi:ovomucoid-like [Canis lupus baileyi]|uniref:Kazal-like domain-containing protein n=1 Tax=Canis lupus familiaris TaxID=9615 RepID=A0A8C0QH59_CANLF|nr:ovomucoid-like [Canis lupus familiaris]XP_025303736.1 ovomucoid-like [Canis lupus dingo]XP_038386510.1 ovomucoid-like [Canis lupus familiaris]|eukprot:XP_022265021.1 ovomucoid-like [Canis lupus familiaris]
MSLFSSWIEAIFIISLVFPLYSETSLPPIHEILNVKPNCEKHPPGQNDCTTDLYPVCASNGNTYGNLCAFCTEKRKSGEKFTFLHFGAC